MANAELFMDRLGMDVASDLERIDGAITQIILDPNTREDFLRDPNGVLIRLGMHPPASTEVNERVNRTFYAVVTNKELTQYVSNHYQGFRPTNLAQFTSYHLEGLSQGRIQNDLQFDLQAADHLFKQPEVLKQVFKIMLYDLNSKRILKENHSRDKIDQHIEDVVTAITERKPIREHPVLEEWDRNYGVGGHHYGTEAVEVGPAVTAYVAVELGAFVTALALEQMRLEQNTMLQAALGDTDAIRAFSVMSKLMNFGADLISHAYYFENRR